jgi:putative transposase
MPSMSHRYENLLVRRVFSTKDRKPLIRRQMKRKLWAYIGGIARTNNFKALAVGGMLDHVHVLLSLPTTLLAAKAVQLIKGGSSKWLNDHLPRRSFAWQDAYGAFTIATVSQNSAVKAFSSPLRGLVFALLRFPVVETAGYFHPSRSAGLASERLMLVRRLLAVLRFSLRLVFRQIFQHFRICDRSRDNVTTAGPLAQIDQPATVAAEGKVLLTRDHYRAARGAAQRA